MLLENETISLKACFFIGKINSKQVDINNMLIDKGYSL